jgi:starch synthase (maltosyl-transferring)
MPEPQAEGRRRVVIERVRPQIDCGRFPIKRVAGETLLIEADVFADGHDEVACRVVYWRNNPVDVQTSPMKPLGNDRWRGDFTVPKVGRYHYTIEAWVDPFQTWRSDLAKRIAAAQDIRVDLLIGARIMEGVVPRASGRDRDVLVRWMRDLRESKDATLGKAVVEDEELAAVILRYPERHLLTRYDKELAVVVDREKAVFSAWYEVFPRSCSPEPGRHGTLRDCQAWLPYIASMGFDVVYLPPIHPIGHTFRKGKNNSLPAQPGDVGSPWAIGSAEGGHTAVHPELGTLADYKKFIAKAAEHGLEVAFDLAYQCTPDHPYVQQHPGWFQKRPDGTIQYAENPPKKYQDIYPLNFESEEWQALWTELETIVTFWIGQGVRIFRVDNPHTKPFSFWEWMIGKIKDRHPDVLFLAEAFTRPLPLYRLAKAGFSQSYTYFTWRNNKQELTDYFTELTQTEVAEYFRPHLWTNTPDILPEFLQTGGRPAFMIRFLLAATLGAGYGMYGPAFELCENTPLKSGGEEYLNSEKYELRHRDLHANVSLKDLISRVNTIRRENPALRSNHSLRFHGTDNPSLLCYSKVTGDLSSVMIMIVNLDCFNTQSGWVDLDLDLLGIDRDREFQVHDLLGDGRFLWRGSRNFVKLSPESLPAHILRVRRWVRTERDFDYFL